MNPAETNRSGHHNSAYYTHADYVGANQPNHQVMQPPYGQVPFMPTPPMLCMQLQSVNPSFQQTTFNTVSDGTPVYNVEIGYPPYMQNFHSHPIHPSFPSYTHHMNPSIVNHTRPPSNNSCTTVPVQKDWQPRKKHVLDVFDPVDHNRIDLRKASGQDTTAETLPFKAPSSTKPHEASYKQQGPPTKPQETPKPQEALTKTQELPSKPEEMPDMPQQPTNTPEEPPTKLQEVSILCQETSAKLDEISTESCADSQAPEQDDLHTVVEREEATFFVRKHEEEREEDIEESLEEDCGDDTLKEFEEENCQTENEKDENSNEPIESDTEALKESPLEIVNGASECGLDKPEGKHRYSREILLQISESPCCKVKPVHLPKLEGVTLEVAQEWRPTDLMEERPHMLPIMAGSHFSRSSRILGDAPRHPMKASFKRPAQRQINLTKYEIPDVANAYKLSSKAEIDESEKYRRHLRSLLNKMTPDNLPKILEEGKQRPPTCLNDLNIMAELIFDKVNTEPQYADIIIEFSKEFLGIKVTQQDPNIGLKNALLRKAQSVFESPLDTQLNDATENLSKEIESAEDDITKRQLEESRVNRVHRVKVKYFNNCKFISKLYLHGIAPPKIMTICLSSLKPPDPETVERANIDEEKIECLCTLLKTTGGDSKMENEIEQDLFVRLEYYVRERLVSNRIRFLIQDTLELRKAGWKRTMPSRSELKPVKLDEVAAQNKDPISESSLQRSASTNLMHGGRAVVRHNPPRPGGSHMNRSATTTQIYSTNQSQKGYVGPGLSGVRYNPTDYLGPTPMTLKEKNQGKLLQTAADNKFRGSCPDVSSPQQSPKVTRKHRKNVDDVDSLGNRTPSSKVFQICSDKEEDPVVIPDYELPAMIKLSELMKNKCRNFSCEELMNFVESVPESDRTHPGFRVVLSDVILRRPLVLTEDMCSLNKGGIEKLLPVLKKYIPQEHLQDVLEACRWMLRKDIQVNDVLSEILSTLTREKVLDEELSQLYLKKLEAGQSIPEEDSFLIAALHDILDIRHD